MENYYAEENRPQQSLVQLLMFRYLPYWPLFVVLAIVFLAGGYFYLKVTPPKYRSTASVLIKDEKKGVDNSQMIESLNIYASKKIVENEIEVVKSKTLLLETVKQLNLCAPVYTDALIGTKGAYSRSPVVVEVQDVSKIRESKKMEFVVAEDSVFFSNKTYPLDAWIKTGYGTIRFVRNKHVEQAEDYEAYYFSLVDPRRMVEALESSIEVSPVSKLSTVVNLSIVDEEPKRGEDILNTLLSEYTKASIDEKNALAANTMEFVEDRILSVERQLDSVEAKIQQYKSSRGVVDLSEQGKLYLQNVGENDRRVSEMNMQLAVLDKVESYVVGKDNRGGLVPSTLGISDPGLTQLIEKLSESEIKYERLSKTTPANNLIMVSLRKEIDQIRPGILENIQNQRQSLKAGLGTINQSTNRYASVLQTIPKKERELLEINRQQLIKNNVYTFLLQKREETALAYASNVGDSRLIDKATTGFHRESPKGKVIYVASLALAFILGIGWVSIKEVFSSKILFRSEIEERTEVPVTAEISHTGLKDFIVVNNSKEPILAEQFRQLRASIGMYGKSEKKVIMVTSSIPGEGKSFISANFALSLAVSNKKVLLIDMDLRRSRISEYFNLTKINGVSEVLDGEVNLCEAVRRPLVENLYVLGTGLKTMNPTDLLLNGNLEGVIEMLKASFDFIIIDTAPVDLVSDGYIIAEYCDVTLFVMRHGKTFKSSVSKSRNCNEKETLKNLSIVFNGVKRRGFFATEYGYGRIGGMYYSSAYSSNFVSSK